jgi:hypothetical protein
MVTKEVHFGRANRGRKVIAERASEDTPDLGRVPRIARLMAMAIHVDDLVRRGEIADYAELARLAHVTRPRATQVMNLTHLAPEIQEELLGLARSAGGQDALTERQVRPIAAVPDWRKQRAMWRQVPRRPPQNDSVTLDGPAGRP